MQHVDFLAVAEKALRKIEDGAFLIVQGGDKLNVMTIGWASIGFLWGRPILTILVRKSRYTFSILENATEFTVSVPLVDMKKEIELCGTVSGKKVDKLRKCKLEIFPGEKVKTPILNIPGIHFECKIVYRTPMNPSHLVESYKHLYPEKDYHSMYFGEIVYSYSTEDEKVAP